MEPMIFLGIDPGIADMGYGVIEISPGKKEHCLAYGSVKTAAGTPMQDRLRRLYAGLEEVIQTHRPQFAGIEKLYFSKNVKTAFTVAEARGVIRLCIEHNHLPLREFNPSDVKIAVCGHGAATKPQVQKMVQILLGLKSIPQPDDAADALAIALALAHTRKYAAMDKLIARSAK